MQRYYTDDITVLGKNEDLEAMISIMEKIWDGIQYENK